MNFQSIDSTVRPIVFTHHPDPRRSVPAGVLSRREFRRIIAEQLD